MIEGQVTANREAIVQITVRGPTGDELEIDAVVDTGFGRYRIRRLADASSGACQTVVVDLAATRLRVAGGWQRDSL